MSRRARTSLCLSASLSVTLLLLLGCSTTSYKNPTNLHLEGVAMGGQQPIGASTLQLYAVNTSGTGPTYTSTPLLPVGAAALTSSDGSGNATNSNANAGNANNSLPIGYFTITNDYTCPSPGAQVYLAASGGNPGLAAGTNNADIVLLLALGACGQLSGSTTVIVNEVSTVGSIAALFPYMSAYNAVGSPGSNADFLAEEFSVANEYMNVATGFAPGATLPSGYYASSNEVNTLANLLATCVNTGGGTAGDGTACGNIMLAAKPPGTGSTSPTDTVGLLLDILNNPTNNVSGIYNYISRTPPFYPYDLSAPSDWTLPIIPVAQTPYASPAAGMYAGAQTVTLTSPTSNATIYYTTNGTTPTASSSVYSGPLTVSASETLKAIAGLSRSGLSAAGSFGYNITGAAATPVFSLAAGTYNSPQTYTVTSPTPDAAVYITTDGTTPTAASTLVTSALQLGKTETLKAVAIYGGTSSGVASAAYAYAPVSGMIYTFAGGSITSGDNIAATSAELSNPYIAAVDAGGNLYIADSGNNSIRKVSAVTGVITTVAGGGLSPATCPGTTDPLGDGCAATSATLYYPDGVAVDASGNLYISDNYNHRIRKVTAATGVITTVAGGGANPSFCTGSTDSLGDGCAATSATLSNPIGIAVDAGGNLYIADANNNRIRKVTAAGVISTVAGNGTACSTSASTGCMDGGPATSAELYDPVGVAVDAGGNLYIADDSDNRVRKVTAATGTITTIAGNGTAGYSGDGAAATSGTIIQPNGVAVDAGGNVYIADTNNNRIRKVTAATGVISTLAGGGTSPSTCTGSTDSVGDGCAATSAALTQPYGVVVDASGNLYIADWAGNRIRKVTPAGFISTVAGNGVSSYALVVDGVPATASTLNAPNGAAVDAGGNLYIVDTSNNRIRKVTVATGVITTVAGSGVACSAATAACGDNGPATSAQFYAPRGIAVDAIGNLYIADYADHRIRKVTAATGIITTVAGSGTQCTTTTAACGDNGAATSAQLNLPRSVAVDASGNLYIADTSDNRIRLVTAGSQVISTVAGTGSVGSSGDGGRATQAKLDLPSGVALDASGNLYIADTYGDRIRLVNNVGGSPVGGGISTFAGTGVACTTSASTGCVDGGLATSGKLNLPRSVALDANGNLYIADLGDNRIRKVTGGTGGNIYTVAGNGTAGFAGDAGAATAAEISGPISAVVDANGNLYIVDMNNNRIRVVYP